MLSDRMSRDLGFGYRVRIIWYMFRVKRRRRRRFY